VPVVVNSLLSVFLLIAVGWALKATRVIDDSHWVGFERVTYQVLFPAVVIATLSTARLSTVPFAAVGLTLVACIAIVTGLLLAARPALAAAGIDGPAFTSVFQGAARWNTFVALALAGSLFSTRGIALMAVAIAAMIPLLNTLSVLILGRFASGGGLTAADTARTLIRNPFIWSSLLGLALNPVSDLIPVPIGAALDITGRAALAAGLLVVGAGLDLRQLARPRLAHAIATMLKLGLMPLLALLIGRMAGLGGMELAVTIIAAAVPTATGSYILARQMGGDAPLMAEITTLETLLALFTLPLWLAIIA
jgi:hypothetical protein